MAGISSEFFAMPGTAREALAFTHQKGFIFKNGIRPVIVVICQAYPGNLYSM